eukprot:COSAG05_NODE_2199_length_3410_cov_3.000906_4_plen_317_part_00
MKAMGSQEGKTARRAGKASVRARPRPLGWVQRVMQPAAAEAGDGIVAALNLDPRLFEQCPTTGLLRMGRAASPSGRIRNRDKRNLVIPVPSDVADERIMVLFVNFAQELGFSVAGYDQRDGKLLTFDRPGPRERSRVHAEVVLTASQLGGSSCCSRRVDTVLQPYAVRAAAAAAAVTGAAAGAGSVCEQRYIRLYGDISTTGCLPCCCGRARRRHVDERVFAGFQSFMHSAGVTTFARRGPPRPSSVDMYFGGEEDVAPTHPEGSAVAPTETRACDTADGGGGGGEEGLHKVRAAGGASSRPGTTSAAIDVDAEGP